MNITAADWAMMPPATRAAAVPNISPLDAAILYSKVPSSPDRGPRLTRAEWQALGERGRCALKPFFEPWERAIIDAWEHQDNFETAHPSPKNEAWTLHEFKVLIIWTVVLPPVGLIIWIANFWRPGRSSQSWQIFAAALVMLFLMNPIIDAFRIAMFGD